MKNEWNCIRCGRSFCAHNKEFRHELHIPLNDDIILWKFHLRFDIRPSTITTKYNNNQLITFYSIESYCYIKKNIKKMLRVQKAWAKESRRKQPNSTWITFVAKLWSFSKYLRLFFSRQRQRWKMERKRMREKKHDTNEPTKITNDEKLKELTRPKMSVNYWKNVFLSPLCDRSYKTGIYAALPQSRFF